MAAFALAGLVFALSVGGCLNTDPQHASQTEAPCFAGGDWEQTADAEWLREALSGANLPIVSCTGSAFVVRLRPRHQRQVGLDVYIWAFGPAKGSGVLTEEAKRPLTVSGIRVYANELRAVWVAHGRYVWVQAGPTASTLPPLDMLSPIVTATIEP